MPKIVDHQAYRQQIIEKAVELFVKNGYEGLGMREVAKHLGISKSALYHYFPSKEALFEQVVQAVIQADIAQLDIALLHSQPLPERFDTFVQHILDIEDYYAQQFFILADYARVRAQDDETTQPMQTAGQTYVQAIATALKITEQEAEALYLQLTGAVLQRIFDGRRTDLHLAMAWLRQMLNQKYQSKEEGKAP